MRRLLCFAAIMIAMMSVTTAGNPYLYNQYRAALNARRYAAWQLQRRYQPRPWYYSQPIVRPYYYPVPTILPSTNNRSYPQPALRGYSPQPALRGYTPSPALQSQ
ncbi:hypothetical protein [Roseiconus lacunae]|uniref:Uncharacterized protein n=1 Tax=Roseiconus lacunae TaxID=2605694 RepID=A0ABT7PCM9_9BACT|nr:hypothetical protein [Roseiconus lacunae]MCD0463136.1 hypothetical protein [Roseiconus lacunae]MDM4014108.1 hypothetical protein [Roseiconus lacunae]WRQ53408.1 hypothetical protein U8335_12985 [Stieleria sp. HD01]